MVIYLPSQSVDEEPALDELTPREIVRELDKHVIGQNAAKRAVAIALRNRMRRQKLAPELGQLLLEDGVLHDRRGQLPACCCRHVRVDGPERPSGRTARPSGVTPSTIMSPTRPFRSISCRTRPAS